MTAFFVIQCSPPTVDQPVTNHLITGVVEGFYGDPWSHVEREDMIAFMGEFGLKHYVYAPKDDPLHRSRWAQLYPDSMMVHFDALLEHGRKHGVTIWFAISPGLSMQYSSDTDRQALKSKLDQVVSVGFRNVALFFDDVPEQMRHQEDVKRYPSLAEAHADVIVDIYKYLGDKGAKLWVCPTVYAGTFGDPDYMTRLGHLLPPEIPLFWTGPDVASPDILIDDVQAWMDRTGRKPLIWDNFPVNDFEVWRPFLGGYPHRSALGLGGTLGLIANPSPDPYVSMPGLATMTQLVNNPTSYNSNETVKATLAQIFGSEGIEEVTEFVDLYSSYGWEDHVFSPLYKPGLPIRVDEIESALTRAEQALDRLNELPNLNRRLAGFVAEMGIYISASRNQFERLQADERYWVKDDHLLYRDSLDTYQADEVAQFDQDALNELKWHPLHGDVALEISDMGMGFATDGKTLYAVLKISEDYLHSDESEDIFRGDRITLVVAWNSDSDQLNVSESDPFLVLAARPPDPVLDRFALHLEGFAARGIADIQLRQVSSFFHQFATQPNSQLLRQISVEYWTKSGRHFFVASIPLLERRKIRMNWTVSSTPTGQPRRLNWMASNRPYLGNPQTWITILTNQ